MATLNDISTYFFGGPVEIAYGTFEGFGTEQGIDVKRPVGAAVNAVHGGTVVWANGYQVVVQIANNLYESYTHIVSTLQPGQSVQAGQQIGTISNRTGWPLYVNGDPYWSTGPHVEFGVYSSAQNAISFRSGINPAVDLAAAYAARNKSNPGGSTSPICNIPFIGPVICGAGSAASGAAGSVGKTIAGVPGDIAGAVQQGVQAAISAAVQNALTALVNLFKSAGGTILGWLGKTFGKWLVLIGIGLAMLVVFAALLEGEKEQALKETA